MKRMLFTAAIAMSLLPMFAQDATSGAALAARQAEVAREYAEKFNIMQNDLEALRGENGLLRDELGKLRQEIAKLRDEQSKTAMTVANNNPEKDLKRLAEAITDVDKKRVADRQEISEEIKKSIAKLDNNIAGLAKLADRPVYNKPKDPTPSEPQSEKGYTYTVQSGDSLSAIIKAYNAEFKSKGMKTVTTAQVKAANPKLDLEKPLKVGMKIVIPAPPSAKEAKE